MVEMHWKNYLDEIRGFSAIQGEPNWMLELRLSALEQLESLALPEIERVKIKRWPLLNVGHFEETSWDDELGSHVYAFDESEDHPLIVQQGRLTTVEQLPQRLIDQGVILTDIFTALQEYPELVHDVYMNLAVKSDEDQLTAFHAAFMNSGIFLYVPKNVVIDEPIEAIFLNETRETSVYAKHILIVAEENSEFSYLERFQTIENGEAIEKVSGNIIVEVIAKPGSRVRYAAIDQLGEHLTTYINRRGYLMKDSSIDWAIGLMNDGNVIADFDSDLVGEGSHSEVKIVAISSGKQTQGIDTRVTNKAPYSIGHILQHGVILDKGTLTFNGIGHIIKGAKGADAQQESRVLMLSDKARGDANPILLIDENEVTAGHAASVGRVDPEEMFYLMSRGLPKEEAEKLVIRGFLGNVLTAIPVRRVQNELAEVIEGKLTK